MKLPFLTGALAVVAATAAFAGDPASTTTSADAASTFKSLDVNGDGRITADEARAHADLSAGYEGAVSDSDQGMSMAEFEAWAANRTPGAMTPQSSTPQSSTPQSSSPEPVEVPPSN